MAAAPRRIRLHIPLSVLFCLVVGGQPHAQVGPNGEIEGLTAKFVDVSGVRTRYYDYGQGEAIVLLHGGWTSGPSLSSANIWSRNIPGLAKKFRVLAVDRLAQGMTGNPNDDRDFGSEGDVEHLYQFVRAMKLDKVHLVAHSSGGPHEVYFALEHPEIVKTVTWVSGGGGFRTSPSKFTASLSKCPPDQTSDEYRKCFRSTARLAVQSPGTFPPEYANAEDFMANLPKWSEKQKRVAALRADNPQLDAAERAHRERMWGRLRAGALQLPVLVYSGKQDFWDWDSDALHATQQGAMNLLDILAKNPRVKFIVVNKAGHFVQREQPEQFNADLVQFIEFWNNKP